MRICDEALVREALQRSASVLGLGGPGCCSRAGSSSERSESGIGPTQRCKLTDVAAVLRDLLHADRAFVVHLSERKLSESQGSPGHERGEGLPYAQELVDMALEHETRPAEARVVADVGSALLSRGCSQARAQEIVQDLQAGSCAFYPCVALGSLWALAAVHYAQTGRVLSEEERNALSATGDCVASSLALEAAVSSCLHPSKVFAAGEEQHIGRLLDQLQEASGDLDRRKRSEELFDDIARGLHEKRSLEDTVHKALIGLQGIFDADFLEIRTLRRCGVDAVDPSVPREATELEDLPELLVSVRKGAGRAAQKLRMAAELGRVFFFADWRQRLPLDEGGPLDGADEEEKVVELAALSQMGYRSALSRVSDWGNETMGLVTIGWADGRVASEADRSHFDLLCNQAGRAVEQDKLQRDLASRNRQLAAEHAQQTAVLERRLRSEALLRDIACGICRKLSMREVLCQTVDRIRELFDASMVVVHCLRGPEGAGGGGSGGGGGAGGIVDVDKASRSVSPIFRDFTVTAKHGSPPAQLEGAVVPEHIADLRHHIQRLFETGGRGQMRTVYVCDWATTCNVSQAETSEGPNPGDVEELKAALAAVGAASGFFRGTEWGGEMTGVVSVFWSDEHAPTAHERALFEAVCDQIGQLFRVLSLYFFNSRALKMRMVAAQIGQDNLLRVLERRLQSEALLRHIAKGMRTNRPLPEVMVEAVGGIRTLFKATAVLVEDIAREPPMQVFAKKGSPSAKVLEDGQVASTPPAVLYRFERLRAEAGQVHVFSDFLRYSEFDEGGPAKNENDRFRISDAVYAKDAEAREKPDSLIDAASGRTTSSATLQRRLEAIIATKGLTTIQAADLHRAQEWAGETPGPDGLVDAATVQLLRESGCRTAVARATTSCGLVNGVVGLTWGEPNRTLGPADLALFEDVCEVLGIALAQASLVTQAQQAARAKSDFLSVITHEMRTPMQAVLGITDLLLDMNQTVEQREYLSVIRSSAQALVDLVSEVLDASILERGGSLRVAADPMDLRSTAEEVMDMMWPVAAQKNVALQIRMGVGVPRFIFCDKGRIRQVIVNLVGNSAKFSTDGRIIVELEAEGCPDTGCGIPEASQAKLFRFFTQLDSSKSRRHQGTGLGLFISKHIALALEGSIDFVSTVGSGSTFAFTFRASVVPQGDRALPTLQALCPPKEDPLLKGKTLVVGVDDLAWEGTIAVDAASWGVRVCLERTVEGTLGAVRREAAEGRGAQLAGAVFFMPSLVPPAKLPAVVDGLLEELQRARGAADRAPPPLILLRIGVRIEKAFVRENVISLRLPVSERMLYKSLTESIRARTEGPPAEAPQPPQPTQTEPIRSHDLLTTLSPELEQRLEPASEPAAAPRPVPPAEGDPKRPIRILFSEDTPTNAKIVTVLLRKLGYSDVEHAEDGARALQAAKAAAAAGRPFDVLLSDIMMPEMDGLESLRRMRAELPAGRVPYAVALSANVGAHDRQECAEAGYDAFLAKPVRTKELSEALKAAEEAVASRRAAGRPAGGAESGSAGLRLEESADPSAAAALPIPTPDRAFVVHLSEGKLSDSHGSPGHDRGYRGAGAGREELPYAQELVDLALEHETRPAEARVVADVGAALLSRGCSQARVQEIVQGLQAGSCAFYPCVAFGSLWALAAVHHAQAGRVISEEERNALCATGDCGAYISIFFDLFFSGRDLRDRQWV
eukprot:tig00020538_g10365.t1